MIERDKNCTKCKLHATAQFVCLLGQGPEPCDIAIVGEAPGEREDDSGKPFVGKAGKLLEKTLNEYGLEREDIFITNAVSCRPPENRTPNAKEIRACKFWLDGQLAAVRPKYVLLLGNTPTQSLLGKKGIKKLRGKPVEIDGVIYLPTYHPAFILRDERFKQIFESDIRFFSEIVSLGKIPKEEGIDYEIVDKHSQWKEMIDSLWGDVSLDNETTGLYPWASDFVINTIGFGTSDKQWIVPAEHKESVWTREKMLSLLRTVRDRVEDGELNLITQNGKFDILGIWVRYGVRLYNGFDTMIAHYLLDENQPHGLKYLAQTHFGALDYDIPDEDKFGQNGVKKLAEYQALDLFYTRKLKRRFAKQLAKDPDVKQVFDHILMPCSDLFTEIEYHGVCINLDKMDDVEQYLKDRINEAENELNAHIPKGYGEVLWSSPQQVGKLLYERLRIPVIVKTDKGKPSTSESALNQMDHPLVRSLIKFRGAKQQLSFFIEGWKPFLDGNRLHPNFKLHGTVTGRPSCEHPNLQQVPRDPRIRSLITAPPGWSLMEADLSQIELRIAAELSQDRSLVEAFLNGTDPHWLTAIREIERSGAQRKLVLETASTLVQKEISNYGDACRVLLEAGNSACEEINVVWKEFRKKAKAINFGYLYGMWWKKFKQYARDNYGVEVTDEQAEASREAYFDLYNDLPYWHKRQKKFARTSGYVRSLSGRKRRLPAAKQMDNSFEKKEAERQAINSPVQSFASDLNLMAALQLRKEFGRHIVHIVGTVHDAILFEVRNDYVETVYHRITKIMSHPDLLDKLDIKIGIPIEAEAKIGDWSMGVSLEKWKKQNAGKI